MSQDEMTPGYRFENAVDQLERYGGYPNERMIELLEVIADINDDIAHMRHVSLIVANVEKAKKLLDAAVDEYSA